MKASTSVEAVSNALDQQLDFWVDDDDYVTKGMRHGALRSAIEVLKQREQRPTSEDLMTTMLTEEQLNE
jgi:hypothetical protein